MSARKLCGLAACLVLSGCGAAPVSNFGQSGTTLTQAQIEACLAKDHWVGDDLVSPRPEPGHVFKAPYNFRIKMANGSTGFGFQVAHDGHLFVKYPKHATSIDYAVTRSGGVVYFGDKKTSCK
jgi:hypothetical protein